MLNICPVCGYSHLSQSAYINGRGSFEICPSCGFQFEVTDADKGISHEQWRQKWIEEGMIWDKGRTKQPADWNPVKQLENISVKLPI